MDAITSIIISIKLDPSTIDAVKLGISPAELARPEVDTIPFRPEISLVISHSNITLSVVEDALKEVLVPPEHISCDTRSNAVCGLGFIVILNGSVFPIHPS